MQPDARLGSALNVPTCLPAHGPEFYFRSILTAPMPQSRKTMGGARRMTAGAALQVLLGNKLRS